MNTDDMLASLKTNTAERMAALQRQASQVNLRGKDADTGFLVELLPSLFGVFGIGYLYAGMTAAGIARVALSVLIWVIFGILSTVTCGFGALLAPLVWLGIVAMAYFSAKDLKALLPAKEIAGTPPYNNPSGYLEPGQTERPVDPYQSAQPPYQPSNTPPPYQPSNTPPPPYQPPSDGSQSNDQQNNRF